jgi:hypothetical protein
MDSELTTGLLRIKYTLGNGMVVCLMDMEPSMEKINMKAISRMG